MVRDMNVALQPAARTATFMSRLSRLQSSMPNNEAYGMARHECRASPVNPSVAFMRVAVFLLFIQNNEKSRGSRHECRGTAVRTQVS